MSGDGPAAAKRGARGLAPTPLSFSLFLRLTGHEGDVAVEDEPAPVLGAVHDVLGEVVHLHRPVGVDGPHHEGVKLHVQLSIRLEAGALETVAEAPRQSAEFLSSDGRALGVALRVHEAVEPRDRAATGLPLQGLESLWGQAVILKP